MHPLFNQMHSRNNSIPTLSSSPMQQTQHIQQSQQSQQQPPQQQQQQQQQLPPPDLTMATSLPNLNARDHETSYLEHPVFGPPLTDPTTNPFGESVQRPPSSSHDTTHVIPPFPPHHQHPM